MEGYGLQERKKGHNGGNDFPLLILYRVKNLRLYLKNLSLGLVKLNYFRDEPQKESARMVPLGQHQYAYRVLRAVGLHL